MTDLTPQQIVDAVAKTLHDIADEFAKKRKRKKHSTRSTPVATARKTNRKPVAKKKKTNGRKRA